MCSSEHKGMARSSRKSLTQRVLSSCNNPLEWYQVRFDTNPHLSFSVQLHVNCTSIYLDLYYFSIIELLVLKVLVLITFLLSSISFLSASLLSSLFSLLSSLFSSHFSLLSFYSPFISLEYTCLFRERRLALESACFRHRKHRQARIFSIPTTIRKWGFCYDNRGERGGSEERMRETGWRKQGEGEKK